MVRAEKLEHEPVIEVGDLRISPEQFVATISGRELSLTPKEFRLLTLFAHNPGLVLRRDRIAAEVWGGRAPGRTIDIHVARLRSKLPSGMINTVVKIGYRLVPE